MWKTCIYKPFLIGPVWRKLFFDPGWQCRTSKIQVSRLVIFLFCWLAYADSDINMHLVNTHKSYFCTGVSHTIYVVQGWLHFIIKYLIELGRYSVWNAHSPSFLHYWTWSARQCSPCQCRKQGTVKITSIWPRSWVFGCFNIFLLMGVKRGSFRALSMVLQRDLSG